MNELSNWTIFWMTLNAILFVVFSVRGYRRCKPLRQVLIDYLIKRAQRTPYYHLQTTDGATYMERWWLKQYSRWSPFTIRVHRIMRSDEGTIMHDHPAASISIIMRGAFIEVTPVRQSQPPHMDQVYVTRVQDEYEHHEPAIVHKLRHPGSIVFRRATTRHRLLIARDSECWTLFIMLRWSHQWGFYPRHGFTYYREYLGLPPKVCPDQQQDVLPTTKEQ